MTNKNLLSEFSNGEGSVLLVAPRDQRGKTRHEEVKPLQVTMMIMMRMIMINDHEAFASCYDDHDEDEGFRSLKKPAFMAIF